MSGIRLEELKLLVGQNANGLWQFTVAPPEAGCCVVIQSFRERPARWSARASSDRKSTRLNSSHSQISYAVFCLKKKTRRDVSQSHLADLGNLRNRALN